jgi:hypothetical protein
LSATSDGQKTPNLSEAGKRVVFVIDQMTREIPSLAAAGVPLVTSGIALFPEDGESSELFLAEAERRKEARAPFQVKYSHNGIEQWRKLRVFLCHTSADKPSVRNLYRRLTSDGVDAGSMKINSFRGTIGLGRLESRLDLAGLWNTVRLIRT